MISTADKLFVLTKYPVDIDKVGTFWIAYIPDDHDIRVEIGCSHHYQQTINLAYNCIQGMMLGHAGCE